MFNISHPGRYGDLIFALPTVRHLAAQHGPVRLHLPVDPANTTPMRAIQPLLERQPYIAEVVVRGDWSIEQEAPRRPFEPPHAELFDPEWVHLGYREWPTRPLPFYTAHAAGISPVWVDWSPWITAVPTPASTPVLFSWSDRWFELKYGLTLLLGKSVFAHTVCAPESRWAREGGAEPVNILELTARIGHSQTRVVVTDCSMAHVLAAAMGKPCVVVEPEEARHHPIFWPGSIQDDKGHWHQADNPFGHLIYPVIGGDGKPSFDSRHSADLIKEVLARA